MPWDDAAPWWLQSLGGRAFGVDNDMRSLYVEFEAGEATHMHHDLEFMASILLRVDDLPAEWSECLQRREG